MTIRIHPFLASRRANISYLSRSAGRTGFLSLMLLAFSSVVVFASRTIKYEKWATLSPASNWTVLAGEFSGDGNDDVMAYHANNGSLWIGRNTGSSFVFSHWATVSPSAGWQFTVGEFSGEGDNDISAYHPSNGSVWMGRNTGSDFAFSRWATVTPAANWQFVTGEFNGEGDDDIAAYHPSNGSVWMGRNTGSGFSFSHWATVSPAANWQFVAGEFSGEGNDDIAAYHPSNGSVWMGKNTSLEFSFNLWATVDPVADWQFIAGEFDDQGNEDLLGYHPGDGTVSLGANNGTLFDFSRWGPMISPAAGWAFSAGDFTDDAFMDVVGYHPNNGSVWLGKNKELVAEGYAWPLSAAPGETVEFFASGMGSSHVDFFRYGSGVGLFMGSITYTPTIQPVPAEPWRHGCAWQQSFSLTIPPTWPSGIYAARLSSNAGDDYNYITFIVKPDPANQSTIAVLANVNTWLAYNSWGGKGKYSGAALTSFLRPNPSAAPVGEGAANHHLTRAELWILGWLEDEGYQPDVYTDIDFHNGEISGYDKLVLNTHPEYWSTQMFTGLESYLNSGGSLLYLGANGIYESGVYTNDMTQMIFRNGIEDGPREVSMFRVATVAMPEREILGVATEGCSVPDTAFEILQASHTLFAGTGLGNGDTVGEHGLNIGGGRYSGKASGWEVDTSNGPGALGLGCQSGGWQVTPSVLPAGLSVLARANPGGVGGEITFYEHPGGGFVFAAGSITFGGSLVVDTQLQKLIHNVMALP